MSDRLKLGNETQRSYVQGNSMSESTNAARAAAPDIEGVVAEFCSDLRRLRSEIAKMIVGQEDIVEGVIMCVLGGGHALLEGVPGLGKTMLVRTLAECVN